MPSLIDIRRRIRSVKNTQQITKAMKMVSAAKLKRAQERIEHARPYAKKSREVLASVATRVESSAHPLLGVHGDQRIELVVITADRGLCGSFNTSIIKRANLFLDEKRDHDLGLHLVGRKALDHYKRRKYNVHNSYAGIFRALAFDHARQIAADLMKAFLDNQLDAVYVVYNEFKSVMSQQVVVERLLPILDPADDPGAAPAAQKYVYEPDPATIFEMILPRHVELQVWRCLLESAAAEHAARMTAMDAATSNATEMIDSLTLLRNKIRQAAITREILECVSGAEALSARD
jgi:F-type H+-transporting ATPase subunit gamma